MHGYQPPNLKPSEIVLFVLYALGLVIAVAVALFACDCPAGERVSLRAFDQPASTLIVRLDAFDEDPIASAVQKVDLAAFEDDRQAQEQQPVITTVAEVKKEAAAPKLQTVAYLPTDLSCYWCTHLESHVRKGDGELAMRYVKKPMADMPYCVRCEGERVGYPVVELPNGKLVCGSRTLAQLKALARQNTRPASP